MNKTKEKDRSTLRSFKYIPDWQNKKLHCTECDTDKSVKYITCDGIILCNKCVILIDK